MFFVIRTPLLGRVSDIICTHYASDPRSLADRIAIYPRARHVPDFSMSHLGDLPNDPPVTYSKTQALAIAHALTNLANTLPDSNGMDRINISFNDEFIPILETTP